MSAKSLDPKVILDAFKTEGVSFFTGVPDSLLKQFCACVDAELNGNEHVITANEGGAVALAAGHHLSTGTVPLVYLQNSGLGNTVNPLLSLMDPAVYSLPAVLLIGWRGEPGVPDEPQHIKQGPVTSKLLEVMQIPYVVLPQAEEDALEVIKTACVTAKNNSSPFAILVQKETFAAYEIKKPVQDESLSSREEVLATVLDTLPVDTIYVGTTGKLSRELFELRETRGEVHDKDFLTVGSMGHASQIALGIAREKTDKLVVCLDGDGAALMHLGGLATIGEQTPKNFLHIVINNGVHESVGGQTITNAKVNFAALARTLGYRKSDTVNKISQLSDVLVTIRSDVKPALLDIRTRPGSREDLGRPTTTPKENKEAFQKFLQN